ncbi:GumC family protein [Acidimangrovimonas sediminis]|uniref:GumC family protein n=1 Tax=Acidimangrovimonas sediminis TaxID=2056283 RepID=UPI00130495F6|nr:polysaccharide biosynthesis tyrosine autokinase [Acidimangrovimonas sediminis]
MNSRVLPFETGPLGRVLDGAPGGPGRGRNRGYDTLRDDGGRDGGGYGGGRGSGGGPRRRGNGPTPHEPDRVDVRELLRMLWRRRRVAIAGLLIGAVLAFGATRLMTPTYTGLAKVMLETRQAQVTGQAQSSQPQQDLQLNDQVVLSEVAVLQSNVLVQNAIRAIGMDRLSSMDPANHAPSPISRAISAVKGLLGKGGSDKPIPGAPVLTPEQMKMQRLVWAIDKQLSVSREGQSYVLDIAISNPDPVLAQLLANTLADQYIKLQVAGRTASAQNATRFLSDRVKELQNQVAQAEAKVEKFRAENLLVDGGTLDAARQQLGQLNNQLVTARADQIAAQARYDRIQQVVKSQGLQAVTSIVTSTTLDSLTSKLMDLQRQDAIWAQHYGPEHPERVRLAAEIKGVQHDLNEEVQKLIAQRKNDADIASIRETSLEKSIKTMEARVVSLSKSTIGLRALERQASAAQSAYQQLLSRLTDTQTQEQMQRPDARIIQQAEFTTSPSSPRTKLLVIMGGFLGLLFGTGLIFFLELTGSAFRSLPDLEQETGLPVMAAIPEGGWKSPLGAWRELAQNPYGLYAERIRHLRTALLTQGGRDGSRSVMLASSTPGEGKTTTVLALARMASLAGKKVIVVDCDLRRSMLYKLFGWQDERDFASFIANDCGLGEAIHHDEDLGFDVLAAARGRPDVADELAAEWLEPMFETLKRKYDLVLVDAPAMLAVSDALVIGQAVDASLYLVRWNATARQAVAKGLGDCEEAGLHMAGTVFTRVDPRMSPDVYAHGYEYSA